MAARGYTADEIKKVRAQPAGSNSSDAMIVAEPRLGVMHGGPWGGCPRLTRPRLTRPLADAALPSLSFLHAAVVGPARHRRHLRTDP